MKACWFEAFGAAQDVLQQGDWPTPEPGPGEVLVQLHTTGVNPSDVKKRAGAFPDLLEAGPVIPHSDGAGVITAVGEGVSPSRVGERVFVYQAQYGRQLGTAAEYVALDSVRAPTLPDNASFEVGACIGIPIMTAHRCVFADGPVADQLILVTGGAGRVGHYAIQWAHRAGARVIATASNEQDAAACREAGAEAVVNHREPEWGQAVLDLTGGQKIDRVIDVEFGANLPELAAVCEDRRHDCDVLQYRGARTRAALQDHDVYGSHGPHGDCVRHAGRGQGAGGGGYPSGFDRGWPAASHCRNATIRSDGEGP